MVTIKKIIREYERKRNEYTGFEWIAYLESEENYINRVENLCNTIGEIVSVQFFMRDLQIDTCIITYKN